MRKFRGGSTTTTGKGGKKKSYKRIYYYECDLNSDLGQNGKRRIQPRLLFKKNKTCV